MFSGLGRLAEIRYLPINGKYNKPEQQAFRFSAECSTSPRLAVQETQLGARPLSLGTALVVLHRQETRNTGREMRAEIKSTREQRRRIRLTSRFPQFAGVAACFRKPVTHRSKIFVPCLSVKLMMTCSAVRPAIFTPEWTMSPEVCTRVPFLGCSSKLTHCASTTPSAWSIHPTLCPGWQFVIG